MKNPVNLETMWAAAAASGSEKVIKRMEKMGADNRASFAAWVAANKAAWTAPTVFTNPAAVLAAAA